MMIKKSVLALVCIFVLNGCVSITKELPSYTTYTINTELKATKVNFEDSIYIKKPKTIASLNTNALLYLEENRLEKYAFSKLSDTPANLIQEQMASFFSNNNFFYTSNLKNKSSFTIFSELNSFTHKIKNNNSYAIFSIRVYLKNNTSRKIFYKNFSYETKSETNDAKGAVLALNKSLDLFLLDLDSFVAKSIKNYTLEK